MAIIFNYDKMGRVVGHRQNIDAQNYNLAYEYNLAGQLVKEIYPSGREVSVGYDAKGRLSSVADQTRNYLSGLQFQGNGNSLNSMTLGNGTIQTFEMNDRLQMTNQTLKRNTEILQKYDYGYGQIDQSGNLDLTKNNGQLAKVESYIGAAKQWTQKFSYDAIGRLDKSEEFRGDTNALTYRQKFDYDRFGNMYRKAASNPTAGQQNPLPFTTIEDADISKQTNRFTSDTVYDDAGNVIQDTQFRQQNFWYDANGRMYKTANTNNINKSNAVYDASGNRVATQVDDVWTFFVYDAFGKKVAEYGGLQATDEGGVKYVLQDWQGSSRAILNGAGYVQARMDYTAFGEEINSGVGLRTAQQGFGANETLNKKYALTERDKATGLDHALWRKNENRAGRWTSPDPYNGSMSLGNPQSFNRYSYVENQPTNFVDPSGLLKIWSCTRTWQTDGNGNRIYSSWQCSVVYDDGQGGGNLGSDVIGGIEKALKALSDPKSPCAKLFDANKLGVSPDEFFAKLLQEGSIGFLNSADQYIDKVGGEDFDGLTGGTDLLNPAEWFLNEAGFYQRNPNPIPKGRTYDKATAVINGQNGKTRTAYVLIHELGHIADKQFGSSASALVSDQGRTKAEGKKLQKQNRETMKDCEKYLKKLK